MPGIRTKSGNREPKLKKGLHSVLTYWVCMPTGWVCTDNLADFDRLRRDKRALASEHRLSEFMVHGDSSADMKWIGTRATPKSVSRQPD